MKIKRYKKVNRHLNFYINNYGFRQPYQILIDGTFCFAALNNQVNIADNIPRYLQGELKLLTTQCTLIETENLGAKVSGALKILKQYPLHKCGHEGKPIPAAKCLLSMIRKKNTNHYFIATQDRDLQQELRMIPGIPLLYLHTKTPVLDPPSEKSLQVAKNNMSNLLEAEKSRINELKEKNGLVQEDAKPKKRKKKGPNPLSCKKKKKKIVLDNPVKKKEGGVEIQKKARKKLRIPAHVKEVFLKAVHS